VLDSYSTSILEGLSYADRYSFAHGAKSIHVDQQFDVGSGLIAMSRIGWHLVFMFCVDELVSGCDRKSHKCQRWVDL
jgi:hypothetical protein